MKIASEQAMIDYGRSFAERLLEQRAQSKEAIVIELLGDVGAGKTTFTRGLAAGLGVVEPITSPSYTISKRYTLPAGGELVHYDFYRLPDPGLMAEDLAESLSSPSNIVVVEWATSVADLLPPSRLQVEIFKHKTKGSVRLMRFRPD